MMGGGSCGNGAGLWPWLVLLALLVLVVGPFILVSWHGRQSVKRVRRPAGALARDRYDRGELTQRRYRAALVGVL